MARNGRPDLQLVALVDPHRRFSAVRFLCLCIFLLAIEKIEFHFTEFNLDWYVNLCRFDYIEEGGKLYKDTNRLVAYYKGLTTWSRWVNRNIDPSKTKVFFQGVSPMHYE